MAVILLLWLTIPGRKLGINTSCKQQLTTKIANIDYDKKTNMAGRLTCIQDNDIMTRSLMARWLMDR